MLTLDASKRLLAPNPGLKQGHRGITPFEPIHETSLTQSILLLSLSLELFGPSTLHFRSLPFLLGQKLALETFALQTFPFVRFGLELALSGPFFGLSDPAQLLGFPLQLFSARLFFSLSLLFEVFEAKALLVLPCDLL